MFHLQLSVESVDKPLLECHEAISLKAQRNVDFENLKFSKWTEAGDGEKQSDQFPFRAKFQPRIWGRLSLITATYTSKYVSCLLIYMSFTYPKVLTIQGLVHLCIHFRSGAMSHHSIQWHWVSINLNIKEQEKEDEEAGGKRRKSWCFPTTGQALKKLRDEKKGKGGGRGLAHLPLKSQHHCKPIFKGLQKTEER